MGNRAYFISDIHLENMQERNGEILLRFLHFLAEQKEVPDLYLLGDIFDFWISGHKVFVKKFEPLWEPLKKLKERGANLVYFEGNHDLHLHPFWKKKLGFELFANAEYRRIGGYNIRLEHGDLMNPNDTVYLKWRAFTRNPRYEFLAHILPGFVWDWVGNKLSENSRKKSRQYTKRNEEPIREMVREHALKAYQEKPFDILISGHMHVHLDEKVQGLDRPVRNINLGSWLGGENPRALCIEGQQISWVELK
jgi:UDP-2,3-diacylglucosamine hydrolase